MPVQHTREPQPYDTAVKKALDEARSAIPDIKGMLVVVFTSTGIDHYVGGPTHEDSVMLDALAYRLTKQMVDGEHNDLINIEVTKDDADGT